MPEDRNSQQPTRRERERARLIALSKRRPAVDVFPGTGVVLNDGIQRYCADFDLISPFEPANLKPANYKLTVGDEYVVGGKRNTLSDEPEKNKIVIPSFEVVVVKTWETLNMPRFLIARWNIRVGLAYRGLLWVGGPQVDAGYVGHLFCPIYNLSDREVVLTFREPIAVIDFVKTTDFHVGQSLDYEDVPPKRILIEDFEPENLKSALATIVKERLTEFGSRLSEIETRAETEIDRLEARTNHFLATLLTLLTLLFAILALFVSAHITAQVSALSYAAFGLSALAIALSVIAVLVALRTKRSIPR